MNVRYALSCAFLSLATACIVRFDDSLIGSSSGAGGNEQNIEDEYSQEIPSVSVVSSTTGSTYFDHWDCGTELIEVEGPDGYIKLVEIPILCDPTQDEYRGCPIEESPRYELESEST